MTIIYENCDVWEDGIPPFKKMQKWRYVVISGKRAKRER